MALRNIRFFADCNKYLIFILRMKNKGSPFHFQKNLLKIVFKFRFDILCKWFIYLWHSQRSYGIWWSLLIDGGIRWDEVVCVSECWMKIHSISAHIICDEQLFHLMIHEYVNWTYWMLLFNACTFWIVCVCVRVRAHCDSISAIVSLTAVQK